MKLHSTRGGKSRSYERKILLILVVVLGMCINGSFSCPEDMYQAANGLCCKLCLEGTYLVQPCNVSKGSSFCQPCLPSTYMTSRNNRTECEACTNCEPSKVVLVQCAPDRNRECGCERGKYHDPSFLFCLSCKKCTVGEGVQSPCTKRANTKCQPCPKGTFSDKVSFEEKCKPCTKCEPAELMVVKSVCNASTDTVCERTNLSLIRIEPTKTQTTVSLTIVPTIEALQSEHPIKKESKDLPYYMAAIGAVGFICVLIGAVCCYLIRKRRGEHNVTNDNANPPDETEMTEYSFPLPGTTSKTPAQACSSQGLQGRRTTTAGNNGPYHDSDSQASNSSLQGVTIGNGNKTLVRDLPGHIFIDLGRLLNPKSFNNLVKLAGHLGFTNSHVQNFGLHPEEATQKTLEEWEQTEGSTVDVLINILKEMKRDDCVQVLKPWDSSS